MLRLVPFIASLAALFGLGTLVWYQCLSEADQLEADRRACELFGRCYNRLGDGEALQVRSSMRHAI